MPDWFDKLVRRRGGVVRWRTIKRGGHLIRIAVTRKKGKRGGKSVGYRIK